jgi:predicted acyltransferase
MMAEMLHLRDLAAAYPDSGVLEFLAYHQSHVSWVGCSIHDLIQPSFSFLVGVSLPYSIASRRRRGQSVPKMIAHAAWRSLVLICLGIFLRSLGREQTRFTFEDTLTQIGLGYVFLFMLGLGGRRLQWIGLAVVLMGYWAAFALYPLPDSGFDWPQTGVTADWQHHLTGFAAHWNKNTNLAWAFDRWFLNLFPREAAFVFNGGGYSTLSFIPTLGTMILGLIAGGWMKNADWSESRKVKTMGIAGLIGLALGMAIGAAGVCPVVKRIWTPSWTLFSGGWCFLILALLYQTLDVRGWGGRLTFWLKVIGMNSIAAYCMDWLFAGFFRESLKTHLGASLFEGAAGQTLLGALVLMILWLILYWMYRRQVFLRI